MNSLVHRQSFRDARGSALVSAAIAAAILSILAAGVLAHLGNEFNLNLRSHQWTQALHLAEAAVEMGFAELNYQYFQQSSGFQSGRGWTTDGSGNYSRTVTNFASGLNRTIGDYAVTVSGVGGSRPVILGVGSPTDASRGLDLSRAVRVTLAPSSKFPVGMMSKNKMDLKGSNFYIDSYDSSDPTKSTSGLYDSTKRQANGDIATNGEVTDTLNTAAPAIYGRAYTGAGGSMSMGNGGSVGPTFVESERATTVAAGEAEGWIRHDFAVDVPDVVLPAGLSSAPLVGNGTIKNSVTLTSGDYMVNTIQLRNSDTLTIASGTVRLYVTGNTTTSGQAKIVIKSGASLQIYAAGSMSIAGQGVLNETGLASNNQFYGLPSSTSWDISGNGLWSGTIYAPEADLKMSGGGSSGDASGAIVSSTFTLSGGSKFHYDESLRDNPAVATSYYVVSWQSLRWDGGGWVAE